MYDAQYFRSSYCQCWKTLSLIGSSSSSQSTATSFLTSCTFSDVRRRPPTLRKGHTETTADCYAENYYGKPRAGRGSELPPPECPFCDEILSTVRALMLCEDDCSPDVLFHGYARVNYVAVVTWLPFCRSRSLAVPVEAECRCVGCSST